MANRKKKEERLRKNPPPLPRKVVLMLKAKRLLGPWRTLRPGKSKTTDMVILGKTGKTLKLNALNGSFLSDIVMTDDLLQTRVSSSSPRTMFTS